VATFPDHSATDSNACVFSRRRVVPVAVVRGPDDPVRERDEPVGFRERQRLQQNAVHDAEDGGRGADADRECEDGGQRETGRVPEPT
jgi:hypothetical protein